MGINKSILFITPGPIEWSSSRIRAHWIAEGFDNAMVVEYEKINRIDFEHFSHIIFVKVVNPTLVKEAQQHGVKCYWDVCDPVHWFSPKESRQMADVVETIVFSNDNLLNDFDKWYGDSGKTILTIPDRIKPSHYPKKRTHQRSNVVRFIWFGAGQNRHSLYGAIAPLERLYANGINLSLTIFDDRPHHNWSEVAKFPIMHTRWALDIENEVIAMHDIAVLPPYPGPWGRVKSNNKELTAWACGVPTWDAEHYYYGYRLATKTTIRNHTSHLAEEYTIDKSIKEWSDLLWG